MEEKASYQKLFKRINKIQKHKAWGLELPTETENYVPKLLALAYVIKKDKLGLNLPSIPNKPVFEIIELNQQIEISTIIETAGIQYNTFTKFNPGYRRSVTPPNRTSNILLPAHAAKIFKEFISHEDTNNWLPFSEYQYAEILYRGLLLIMTPRLR